MEKSKLIGLLKTFNSKEFRAFKDFVASPYFNKQNDLVRLYNYLKKIAPKGFPEDLLKRELVFHSLYPEKTYSDKELNHLMSQLLKLAEQFIGMRKIEESPVLSNFYTLSSYVDRQLDKQYNHILNRTDKKLKASFVKDDNFYLQQFLLSDLTEQHFSNKKIRQFDQNLQTASDHLDIYFLVKKLKYLCAMLDRQKLLHADYTLLGIEEIKSLIQQGNFQNIPSINIYYTLLQTLLESETDQHFFKLKDLISDYGATLSEEEVRDLYYFAINYCIQKIRIGQKAFAKELMELYQEGIEKTYLLDKGEISPWTFKNMVKLGLGLKRFDWVDKFVNEYNIRLPEEKRADAFHFNIADLHYHQKEYDLAMEHLNKVVFTDIHYNLDGKVLLLKIYFENQEDEAFLSLQSSFKIYLIRNKRLPKNVKSPYLNFVNLILEVYRHKNSKRTKIMDKINNTAMLSDRSWLIKQLD